MQALVNRAILVLAVTAGCPGSAQAQEWLLNAGASRFYMQTAKANSIFEVHQFTGLDGTISNGRRRQHQDRPHLGCVGRRRARRAHALPAVRNLQVPERRSDRQARHGKLQELRTTTRISYPLKFTLNLHGFTREIEAPVTVTRLSDKSVSVATAKPIVVTADTFGFGPGIAKLSEAVNGTSSRPAATFTFDLLFETGESSPSSGRPARKPSSARSRRRPHDLGGSLRDALQRDLDHRRHLLQDRQRRARQGERAAAAKRCRDRQPLPGARIEVTGHTDSSAAGRPTSSFPSSGRARWSASCRSGASPPRASKRPATATRGRSCPTTGRRTGPRTGASSSRC